MFTFQNDKINASGTVIIENGKMQVMLRAEQTFILRAIDVNLDAMDDSFETKFIANLQNVISSMEEEYGDGLTKAIRRRLPISGVKINWEE